MGGCRAWSGLGERERALCLSGGEMQEQIRQGRQGSKGRTYSAICGIVCVFQGSACLVSFLAIGKPRGAGVGEGAAYLVLVFSLRGAGLAICEDRWGGGGPDMTLIPN